MHQDTSEQHAIFDYIASGEGNLLINALAGTGKTYSLLKSLERLPQRSALMCSFNKRIEEELKDRLPQMPRGHVVHVKTFHAQGFAMLRDHFKPLAVESSATEEMINRTAGQGIPFKMRRAATRLLRILKETYAESRIPDAARVLALGLEYDLLTNFTERENGLLVEVVRDAYVVSLDFKSRRVIDYCDMVWGPVALDLQPKTRYLALFVDEFQDISRPQFAMLRKLMAPKSRFIAVGDPHQQIYQWRGSMGAAAWRVCEDELKAKVLPLTMTWRCSKKIVEAARGIVPSLRARTDAAIGSIEEIEWAQMPATLRKAPTGWDDAEGIHTFVLSRNNASLLDAALFLWRERVRFELNAGKELLEPLFVVIDTKLDVRNEGVFRASLARWKASELARAEAANAAAYADRIEEQAAMLEVAVATCKPDQIKRLLSDIMLPNDSGVLLSTVHKVKGLEAERVLLLKQTFGRYDISPCMRCGGDGHGDRGTCGLCNGTGKWQKPPEPEELNIEYVGITRAKSQLVWVDIQARAVRSLPDAMLDVVTGDAPDVLTAVAQRQLGIKSPAQQLRERERELIPTQGELATHLIENSVDEDDQDEALPDEALPVED